MIYGISGYKGSGKSTFGYLLGEALIRLNFRVQHDAFANPLKRAVEVALGMSEEQIYGDLKETLDPYWGITPRYAMQTIGTEWGRNLLGPDVWVKSMNLRYEKDPNQMWIIGDLRFRNEVAWIKSKGGILIRIQSPNAAYQKGDAHQSECDLEGFDEWDYDILNDLSKGLEPLKKIAEALAINIDSQQPS